MDADACNRGANAEAGPDGPADSPRPMDYGILGRVIGFPLKLAWVTAYNLLAEEFGDSGVTPQRFSMLELICRNPGCSQTELANALGLSRPATSLIIDFWEGRGCVERRPSPLDRRSYGIFVTQHGKAVHADFLGRNERAEARLASRLSEAEIEQLLATLAKLRD